MADPRKRVSRAVADGGEGIDSLDHQEPASGFGGRLPPLSMLRAFEAVGRFASMRKAGEALGVSHTVVSRHVRHLEAWFDRSLVVSGPRGITLTAAGNRLYEVTAAAFGEIADVTAELRPTRRLRGQLRLWCAPGLAARWLTPRLDALQAVLRDTIIVVRATPDLPDFGRDDADAAVIFSEGTPAAPVKAELLERARIFPVASPAWLATQAPITTIADLAGRKLIHEDNANQWQRFLRIAGHRAASLKGPRLWYASSTHDAALAGQGVALSTRLQADGDIAAGRLVELLDTDVSLGSYWLIAPETRWRHHTISNLLKWLRQEIGDRSAGEAVP
ncbi:LysR substrate-binding domain-containing protein [Labrys neptuniae]